MFILAIILFLIGLTGIIIAIRGRKEIEQKRSGIREARSRAGYSNEGLLPEETIARWLAIGGAALVTLGIFLTGVSSFFAQDVGEASVLRDWTGNITGSETESGGHFKAPWVDAVTFDIRNQRVVFVNPETSSGDNATGTPDGREIQVTDQDGVKSDVDITVRYSIDPAKIKEIYREFKNEDGLKTILIYNDIRSVTRSSAGTFNTLDLLGPGRDDVAEDIQKRLAQKWEPLGVEIDEVSLQQVLAPESVREAYAVAQKSQIEVQKAQNDLDAAEVSSQQKVVQAQAEADANAILNASLSDAILQQRYLDTLAKLAEKGNLVVVPEGFNGLVNVK